MWRQYSTQINVSCNINGTCQHWAHIERRMRVREKEMDCGMRIVAYNNISRPINTHTLYLWPPYFINLYFMCMYKFNGHTHLYTQTHTSIQTKWIYSEPMKRWQNAVCTFNGKLNPRFLLLIKFCTHPAFYIYRKCNVALVSYSNYAL